MIQPSSSPGLNLATNMSHTAVAPTPNIVTVDGYTFDLSRVGDKSNTGVIHRSTYNRAELVEIGKALGMRNFSLKRKAVIAQEIRARVTQPTVWTPPPPPIFIQAGTKEPFQTVWTPPPPPPIPPRIPEVKITEVKTEVKTTTTTTTTTRAPEELPLLINKITAETTYGTVTIIFDRSKIGAVGLTASGGNGLAEMMSGPDLISILREQLSV